MDDREFVERNSLLGADGLQRVVNVRQMVERDIADAGVDDFVFAHTAMQPPEEERELDGDRETRGEQAGQGRCCYCEVVERHLFVRCCFSIALQEQTRESAQGATDTGAGRVAESAEEARWARGVGPDAEKLRRDAERAAEEIGVDAEEAAEPLQR